MRTRQLARQGKKVLIWSGFRTNVEYIADRLSDLGAVYIHGGVDAGDEDNDDTREGKIRRFHDDPDVQVMVANPAAASEGISLHRVCHHAIYLDRSFNAAHYLQSEDRIHRFGLPAGQSTDIVIIECEESIDQTVRARLEFKIGQMADVLQDNSLRPEAVPIDEELMEDYDELSVGLDMGDIQALMASLGGE
jgi:SNF2 family DNA or RNA helicase